jgi:DNA-binding MarR family transcriptional regulator
MGGRSESRRRRAAAAGKAFGGNLTASPAHRFFIYKIGVLRRLLDRYSSPALTEQFNLTLAEWRVLTHLYGAPPVTPWQLCQWVHADKAEISRACAGLVARGYVRRRTDSKDRRSVLLAITPRGERLHDAIIPLRQALQDDLEAPLNAREVAELHRLLDKLKGYLLQKMARTNAADQPLARRTHARSRRAGTVRNRRSKDRGSGLRNQATLD